MITFRRNRMLKNRCGSIVLHFYSHLNRIKYYTLSLILPNQNPVLTDWVFWFCGSRDGRIRTHINAGVRWTPARSRLDGIDSSIFIPLREWKCKSNPSFPVGHSQPPWPGRSRANPSSPSDFFFELHKIMQLISYFSLWVEESFVLTTWKGEEMNVL